jgi:hypothetical protein
MFLSAAPSCLGILIMSLSITAGALSPTESPQVLITANSPPGSSAQRDAIPYADRVSNIVARLKADQLNGFRTKIMTFSTSNEAFEYSRKASSENSHRKQIAANIEATQTWFQSDPQKPDNSVVIFIYLTEDFVQNPLSGIIFELSAREGKPCVKMPQRGRYYAVVPERTISTGAEAVLVARLPSSAILASPDMKCGTVIEAW